MINEKKAILQYDPPTIVLDELSIIDVYKADDKQKVAASSDRQEMTIGALMPFININSFTVRAIEYLKIDMNSVIPELLVVFKIYETQFLFTGYPKDGDLLCLYLKSHSEAYKPIRHDYTIVEVTGPGPDPIDGMPESYKGASVYYTFIVKAQLRIPRIFQHNCQAYRGMTSWEALRKVAKDLNLGFSSNEANTADTMTWINPNLPNLEFIDSVVSKSWKSEEDAFDWWIDPYYNLTFVNVNKQLFGADSTDPDGDTILANIGPSYGLVGGLDSNQKTSDAQFPLLLTNDPQWGTYPFFIKSYTVSNSAGYVVNKYGYKTFLEFYSANLDVATPGEKYVKYPIESVTPKTLGNNDIILRGRPNENVYLDEYKKEWAGVRYFDNTHKNIHQAPLQNLINKLENYKIFLDIELGSYVPWIYRGQYVPVRIVHTDPKDIAGQIGPTEQDKKSYAGETVLNVFLSGKYIILGTSIEYRGGELKTILRLGKRQWTINDGVASVPEPVTS